MGTDLIDVGVPAGPRDGSTDPVELVVVVDEQGRIVHAGGATAELTGSSPRELRLRTLASIVHPSDLAGVLGAVSRAGQAGGPVAVDPARLVAAGAVSSLRAEASTRRDKRGRTRTVLRWSQVGVGTPPDEGALRRGLRAGELAFDYQPVVDLADGRVAGYEALLRWERPGVGRLGPGSFLGLAEDPAMAARLGRHVVRTACEEPSRATCPACRSTCPRRSCASRGSPTACARCSPTRGLTPPAWSSK